MSKTTEHFFGNLFNEKDFNALTTKTTVAISISGGAWLGSLFFGGKPSNLKTASLLLAIAIGVLASSLALKRQKLVRKKAVMIQVENNDFLQKTGVLTGLNAELTTKHLEECLKQDVKPNSK